MNLKGTLPVLVLQVLSDGPRHGYAIARGIKSRSRGVLDFKEGTLYPALHQLEAEGLIVSDRTIVNGRIRRYYKLTKSGKATLADEREEWYRVSAGVRSVLEGTS